MFDFTLISLFVGNLKLYCPHYLAKEGFRLITGEVKCSPGCPLIIMLYDYGILVHIFPLFFIMYRVSTWFNIIVFGKSEPYPLDYMDMMD